MPRRTKIFIAIAVILVIFATVALLYFLYFKKPAIVDDSGGEFPPPGEEVTPDDDGPTVLPDGEPSVFEPILRQLSEVPVAGAVIGNKSGEPIVRYVEKATGNVYEIGANAQNEKRLTNTTIAKVYEAIWSKSGTALLARFVRDGSELIETFSAKIVQGTSGTDGELQGSFLQRGIRDAAISPDGKELFYLQENNGKGEGVRSDLSGNNKRITWKSPLKEWLVSWPVQNKIYILSKPSGFASGMLLSVDPANGNTTMALRNIPGLTASVGPTGHILYSESTESGIKMNLFNPDGKAEKTDITTFPEKCVFSKSGETYYCGVPKAIRGGTYPDVWYQGVIAFNDEIWSANTDGETKKIMDLEKKRGIEMDAVNLMASSDEKFIVFTEKGSGTLWSIQLTE